MELKNSRSVAKPVRRRLVVWMAFAICITLPAMYAAGGTALGDGTCGRLVDPIIESEQFTEFEARMTGVTEQPLLSSVPNADESIRLEGAAFTGRTLDDVPLKAVMAVEGTQVVRYFSKTEMSSDVTMSDFLDSGGVVFGTEKIDGTGGLVEALASELGSRVVTVPVGAYEAALVWADPLINGVRPHHLYWEDDSFLYTLVADRSAPDIVSIGRSIACS